MTVFAFIGLLSGMPTDMDLKRVRAHEALRTIRTRVRSLPSMRSLMIDEVPKRSKLLGAKLTLVRSLLSMSTYVSIEISLLTERLPAVGVGARKGSLSGVFFLVVP